MIPAEQVARFFLACVDPESGDAMTNLRLQKLLYYAQAWHLARHDAPLFPEPVEAWPLGPVVKSVYRRFKECGSEAIDVSQAEVPDLPVEVERHLRWIWDTYGSFSASVLVDLTHSERPWSHAREGLAPDANSTRPIDHAWMKRFYRAMQKPNLPSRPRTERQVIRAADAIARARRGKHLGIPWERVKALPPLVGK